MYELCYNNVILKAIEINVIDVIRIINDLVHKIMKIISEI